MPSLVNGLGGFANFGEGFLQASDDGSTAAIDITSIFGAAGLYLNGTHYKTLFVNNNGNITFGGPLASGNPIQMGQATSPVIIAPYWMDLNGAGPPNPSPGGTSEGTQFVFFDLDASHKTFTATWDDIGYSATHATSPAAATSTSPSSTSSSARSAPTSPTSRAPASHWAAPAAWRPAMSSRPPAMRPRSA